MLSKFSDAQMEKMQIYKQDISARQTRYYAFAIFGLILVGLFFQSVFVERMSAFEARIGEL